MLHDLRERPTAGGLGHVPARDLQSHRLAKVGCAGAHTPQRTDDDGAGAVLRDAAHLLGQVRHQGVTPGINPDRPADSAPLLRDPAFQRDSSPRESRPITKGRDPAAVRIDKIFQIVKRAAPGLEPLEQLLPGRLSLEGMAEHDVTMRQRCSILGQFLQAEDDRICRRTGPCVLRGNSGASAAIPFDRNRADIAVLDRDPHTGLDQRGTTFGSQADPFLIGALFGAHPQMCHVQVFQQVNWPAP